MDSCLPLACGSCDSETVTRTEWDRYTDNIENVLYDEKGRRIFRNFMYTSKMRSGLKVLDFCVHADKVLNYRRSTENMSDSRYFEEIDDLITQADKLEGDDIDFRTLMSITSALQNEDRDKIVEDLKTLKVQAIRALRREYLAFKVHFTRRK